MNAKGLIVVLTQVSDILGMPHFQALITDGSVSQGEFDGTRRNLAAIVTTLKKTPLDKIEAMVAQYNEQLTEHLDKFNAEWGKDTLGNFKDAQIMEGYVMMLMAKSGLKV